MAILAYGKTMRELVNQGWIIITNEDSGEIVGIRSVIQHWTSLTWAERTYYTAKFGFDENGILDIGLSDLTTAVGWPGLFLRPALGGAIVVPEHSLPGSNDRLLIILSRSRVAVISSRCDDTALAHIGPDGTVILTNEFLWGLPDPRDGSYTDVKEGYICHWEVSIATWCPDAPWWALGPEAEELY